VSPEKQRIAIAEACGWTNITTCPETGLCPVGYKPQGKDLGKWGIPDYLNDLNAMHEAEKVLSDGQWLIYVGNLTQGAYVLSIYTHRTVKEATAAQCAEAFLKTLNLWED